MNAHVLSSRNNSLLRTMRLVMEQARRAPVDLVLAEGIRVLEEATAAGCALETVLADEDFGAQPRERALLEAWAARHVPIRRATATVMRELSDVVTSQGVLALVRLPALKLDQVPERDSPLILCLCEIQDPGNLGTLVRTARASGASLLCATEGTVSARNPKAVRASAGALFRIPLVEKLTAREFCDYCRQRRIRVYKAGAADGRACWETDFTAPAAVLLGNEARGFSKAAWPDATPVSIPMSAGVESLNVAAAGAVLMFEAARQRAARARKGDR